MKRMIITASRFQKEIAGDFGDYWKRDALKRVDECTKQADEEAVVEDDGAIKWKDSGNYLMDDFCEVLEYVGDVREINRMLNRQLTTERIRNR